MRLLRKIVNRSKSNNESSTESRLVSPSQRKGAFYEDSALAFLHNLGYQAVARNYQCKLGELDLIMQQEETLVFVEVKYRKQSQFGLAVETVTEKKKQKLRNTAEFFLINHERFANTPIRFDIVSFDNDKICHIINAFGP